MLVMLVKKIVKLHYKMEEDKMKIFKYLLKGVMLVLLFSFVFSLSSNVFAGINVNSQGETITGWTYTSNGEVIKRIFEYTNGSTWNPKYVLYYCLNNRTSYSKR